MTNAANNAFRSATEWGSAIRQGEISCLELLDIYIARIEEYNTAVNAVVCLDIEKAREAAVAADHRIARGEPLGPLHGIPMTVKEAFDIVGMPSTWGVPALAESYPARNAHVVDRLVGAGAIILGKTNVPAWLIIKQRSWSLLRLHLCPTQRSIPFLRHMSWAYRCSKYCCGDQHGNTDKGFNTNGTFEAVSRTGAV